MPTPIVIKKDTSPLVFSEDVEKRIAASWQALQSKDPRVFNGTLLRVLNSADHDMASVVVAPDIGYREVVGVRSHKDFLDWVPAGEQFQVLSAIAFVETADGIKLLRERNSGDWEHSMELSGGFITAKDAPDTVDEYIRHRTADDLSVALDAVTSVERIGYMDYKSICEGMFVFKITLAISFNDLPQALFPFSAIPQGYTPAQHASFFSLPLHAPSQAVIERFL